MEVRNLKFRPTASQYNPANAVPHTDASSAKTLSIRANQDQTLLSDGAKYYLQRTEQQNTNPYLTVLNRLTPKPDEQKDALAEANETMLTCAKIAARVRAGDNVPPADLRYLLKHNARLYTLAMSMRVENDDPKNWKRLSKEEDEAASPISAESAEADTATAESISAPSSSSSAETASLNTSC